MDLIARKTVDFETPAALAAIPNDVYISFPRCSTQRGRNMPSARLTHRLRRRVRGPSRRGRALLLSLVDGVESLEYQV
jgi:hypothetical protein